MEPQLPLFRPQRYGQEICAAGVYGIDNMIMAHFVDFTEAGIHRSNATQAAWLGIKFPGSRCCNSFRAAEEEYAKPTRPRARSLKPVEEIRTSHSFLDRQT